MGHTFLQETLIIWGDRDNVFPLYMGHQLKRYIWIRYFMINKLTLVMGFNLLGIK